MSGPISLAQKRQLAASSNEFGFEMLVRLMDGKRGENVFISPASILQALSMTYNGAGGATAQAMAETLNVTAMSVEELNQANAALWQALNHVDPRVLLAVANALWAEPSFPFAADFLEQVRSFYQAEVANLDFADPAKAAAHINAWVKEKTKDKIDNLLAAQHLVGAVLVLVNAIYFKGGWTTLFDPQNSRERPFTLANGRQKPITMMSQKGGYNYFENDHFQMISLPFGEGQLSMVVLLPRQDTSLAALQPSLTLPNWQTWRARLLPFAGSILEWDRQLPTFSHEQGQIVLPRFKITFGAELQNTLKAMGMATAFQAAGFPHMSCTQEPLLISKVIHKTFLEVNEEGAEAAAATAVVMVRGSLEPPRPFQMIVDRPFFCAIQDSLSDLILFMGAIFDPT